MNSFSKYSFVNGFWVILVLLFILVFYYRKFKNNDREKLGL